MVRSFIGIGQTDGRTDRIGKNDMAICKHRHADER